MAPAPRERFLRRVIANANARTYVPVALFDPAAPALRRLPKP
jgi:hypothetical protein